MQNKTSHFINTRIEKLDNRLANQIAAGEVVDRPASVLKELMENCIDAGARRIEVEIERGGTRLIKVTDDGSGINKDDLALALTRHATSKIKKVEDLSAIYSLGFRGEALASISSVSRLTLTSRTHDQNLAWQAISEGRDMAVEILPASAVAGTRIEVKDLFFNTPARQKFLRAERTEFLQIEDVFKRMALANFEISFVLKHNGKIIKRVPAVKLINGDLTKQSEHLLSPQERGRLTILCGKTFSDLSLNVQCEHENASIKAFIGGVNCHRSESDIQYIFINNRAVKDRTLTHAIRQAYQDRLPPGRMPTYVVFLTIDANKIDVNVHPTKHEVRFENQREIHDLLLHSINEVLDDDSKFNFKNNNTQGLANQENHPPFFSQSVPSYQNYSKERIYQQSERISENRSQARNENQISDNVQPSYYKTSQSEISDEVKDSPTEITRLGKDFCIVKSKGEVWIIRELAWLNKCFVKSIDLAIDVISVSLLFPELLSVDSNTLEEYKINETLHKLGFEFTPSDGGEIHLNGIPVWSNGIDKEKIFKFFILMVELINKQATTNVIDANETREIFQDYMIDTNSINYFLNLEIFEFEIELGQSDSCVRKIDIDLAESLFNKDEVKLQNKMVEQEDLNATI